MPRVGSAAQPGSNPSVIGRRAVGNPTAGNLLSDPDPRTAEHLARSSVGYLPSPAAQCHLPRQHTVFRAPGGAFMSSSAAPRR
jgi:hypothetical protein